MRFITENDLKSINDEYYENGARYYYLRDVIEQIKSMDDIKKTLELGPYKSPLVEGGDVLDLTDDYLKDYPLKIGKFYKHDGSVTPYPFKDKEYDLVIACQVLEHLGTNQKEIFKELCRISKKTIITLPYKWNTPCDIHHMIDKWNIDHWASGWKPVFEKIIKKPSPYRSRILRIYNFGNIKNIEHFQDSHQQVDSQFSNSESSKFGSVEDSKSEPMPELEDKIKILKKEKEELIKTNRYLESCNVELDQRLNVKTKEMAEYLTTLGYLKYKSKNIVFRIKNKL